MANELRKSGIGAVGDIPWGTHFCHFYENKQDLLDVLIPYFKTGLEQNEFCLWRVFDPLDEREAKSALERAMPGANARLAAGDIRIVPQSQWHTRDGVHDPHDLAHDWEADLERALARGYAGMRVNTNSGWLSAKDPRNLDAYEDEFSGLIADRRMIVLCAYPLAVKSAAETLSASYTHRFAIAKRRGKWQVVETPELRQARANVKLLKVELDRRAIERTEELATADTDKAQAAKALHRAEQELRANGERSLCYFELGLVGMAIVSPTKGCIEVNDRLCNILGYERRELMQMTWAALSHPDDLAEDIRNYDRILVGDVDGYLLPKRWRRKNGDFIHTNVSVKCQRNEDGSVDYFAAMIEEVSGADPEGYDGLPDHKSLSGREREVVRLIGLGKTVKEVAAELALSEKTVSTYRRRILIKLNLKSTAELIRYALKNRFAE